MTFLALCFALYFAPAMVASGRRHPSALAIWFTNLLFGWTLIGWVLCLVWAQSAPRYVEIWAPGGFYTPPTAPRAAWLAPRLTSGSACCPVCGRSVTPAARYCSACGSAVQA